MFYEWNLAGPPAKEIGVFHTDGTTTPIDGGQNNVAVDAGDMLFYQLGNPQSDEIKLAYQIS